MKIFDLIFKDKNGHIVIGQRPNWQIIASGLSYLLYRVLHNYSISGVLYVFFIIFLTFWAYEELINGVNYFRKLLGLIALILIVMIIIKVLN